MVEQTSKNISSISQKDSLDLKKVFLAFFILIFGWVLNNVVLAYVHDRVPLDQPPLPDIFFELFPEIPGAIEITEIIMLFIVISAIIVMVFHKYRWVVLRRVFCCAGISYIFRAICIFMLQVPVPSKNTYCAPQMESSLSNIINRVISTFWSAGIEALRPRVLCGDLIVSGHTICLITGLQALKLYSPKKLLFLLSFYKIATLIAILAILIARKHYTIDVFLGYVVATNVFRTYHSLAYSYHRNELYENLHSESIIKPLVIYFEKDTYSYFFDNYLDISSYIKKIPICNFEKKNMPI
uniref:PAP2_C domain-containing protein n=1 Tax=Strongyloides papillosus TaxID=174720 RepID=A0A0N5BJ40_STREA